VKYSLIKFQVPSQFFGPLPLGTNSWKLNDTLTDRSKSNVLPQAGICSNFPFCLKLNSFLKLQQSEYNLQALWDEITHHPRVFWTRILCRPFPRTLAAVRDC
jgi:hypothetical protein